MGMKLFYEEIVSKVVMMDHLQTELMEMIRKERGGERTNRQLFKGITTMLLALGLPDARRRRYTDVFERTLLAETADHYERVAQELLATNNAETVIDRIERCIKEEVMLVKHCMDPATERPLLDVLGAHLLKTHLDAILSLETCGVVEMVTNERDDMLRRL